MYVGESDNFIGYNILFFIGVVLSDNGEIHIIPGSGNKESLLFINIIEPFVGDVAFIKAIDAVRRNVEGLSGDGNFLFSAISNDYKRRYVAAIFKLTMKFDGALGFNEFCPGESREANVNNSAIKDVKRVLELEAML